MNKTLCTSILLVALSFTACKNGASKDASTDYVDSISIIHKQDSLEREKLIAAKGDTIFGTLCFGMNLIEAQNNAKSFVKKLKGIYENGFLFDSYHFHDFYSFYNIEDMDVGALQSDYDANRLYKNKLYSIRWESFVNRGSDSHEIEEKVKHFISLFESKYGKCSESNTDLCSYFGRYINNKRIYVDGIIARWETKARGIRIIIDEQVERNDYYEQNGMPFQYKLKVLFVDKRLENEASKYIDGVVKRELEVLKNKQKEDSIKMVNSL